MYSPSLNPWLPGKWSCQENRYWSFAHRHLRGKQKLCKDEATQELEQRLLEGFLGKKKNNQRQQKRDPTKHQQQSLHNSASVDICVGSGSTNASFSNLFHIWKSFRDCKYLEVLWQQTISGTWLGNWHLHPELWSYLISSENSQEKGSTGTRSSITEAICNFFLYFAV